MGHPQDTTFSMRDAVGGDCGRIVRHRIRTAAHATHSLPTYGLNSKNI